MEAPDKIFMPNELLSEEWGRHIEGQDTEYIRKDALLEWADNYKKHIDEEQLLDDATKSVAKSVLDDLIDKLESL